MTRFARAVMHPTGSLVTTRVWMLLALCALVIASGSAEASNRYDPRFRFRTISTPGFDIHFHQGEEALARRLAMVAETAAKELAPKLGRPRQRVHVILVDQNDRSNGWATPFPYNVIEITAAAPTGAGQLGNTSDWLRLVFVHEYTHVLHLDRARGLPAALGRIFGRHPVLMPNLFVPPWQIEGLATFEETALTGEGTGGRGRLPARAGACRGGRAARSARPREQRSRRLAGGTTPYLYGAYFHQYLARTYGEASLAQLADRTAGRVPYLGSGAFKKVFGKSLGRLWADFEADLTRSARGGFVPRYSPDQPRVRGFRAGVCAGWPAVLLGGEPSRLPSRDGARGRRAGQGTDDTGRRRPHGGERHGAGVRSSRVRPQRRGAVGSLRRCAEHRCGPPVDARGSSG